MELALPVQCLREVGYERSVEDGAKSGCWAEYASTSIGADLVNKIVVHIFDDVFGH